MEGNTIPEGTARESLQEFLNETYQGGDWSPLIDFIKEHYISKDRISDKINQIKEWDKEIGQENSWLSPYQISLLNELLEE